MAEAWREMNFGSAVLIDPEVKLLRGKEYLFVPMDAVAPTRPSVEAPGQREFMGGGSRFMPGDTLMARITPCLENGKLARYEGPAGVAAFGSTEFIVIRGRPGTTDSRFANYLSRSDRVRAFAIGQMTGSSGRQRVPVPAFGKLVVRVPPVAEQRAIAAVLGAFDDKIELNRRMAETLETMARALFKSWFVDFDPVPAKASGRHPGLPKPVADLFPGSFQDSELGPIPSGWAVCGVYAGAAVRYGAPFASALFNDSADGLPLIRIRDLGDQNPQVYTTEAHPKAYVVRPGDIVVGMDGEFRAHVWGGLPAWLNQRLCVFSPLNGFSACFLKNAIEPQLAAVEASEAATTVIHLGKSDIDRFRLVQPPARLLAFFNDLAQPLYDGPVAKRSEARTLAAIRDTLLTKLISGEIRLKAAEKVAASAL